MLTNIIYYHVSTGWGYFIVMKLEILLFLWNTFVRNNNDCIINQRGNIAISGLLFNPIAARFRNDTARKEVYCNGVVTERMGR